MIRNLGHVTVVVVMSLLYVAFFLLLPLQGIPEADGAVPCNQGHPTQRAELPEAAELAMVAAVHEGEATAPGDQCRGAEEGDGRRDQEAQRPLGEVQV